MAQPNRFSCAFTNYHVIGVILVTTDGEVNLVGVWWSHTTTTDFFESLIKHDH